MKSIGIIPIKNLGRIAYKTIKSPRFAIHSFYKRFLAYITYSLGNGYSAPPETVSFFLTYKCNLRCRMCGQWGGHGIYKEYSPALLHNQLSLEIIKRIINEIKYFNPTVTLFGGEPMLYQGWIEIVKEIKDKGLRCNIVTNAVLLAHYAQDMVENNLDEIIFSLDGPKEVHNEIRGVANTFERALEGFSLLNKIKAESKKKKPFITINTTINEFNYHCLNDLIDIATEIGAYHVNIHHLLFLNKKICDHQDSSFKKEFGTSSPDWYGFSLEELPKLDLDVLFQQMQKIKQRKTKIGVSFYPNFSKDEIKEYYTAWEFESKSYANRCVSPWMVAYIFSDGSVRPYHTMNYSPGNINDDSFKLIWNNEKYRNFRQVVKRIKKFPVCSKGCTELYRY